MSLLFKKVVLYCFLFFISLLYSGVLSAQITGCSGTFTDTGGVGGSYGPGEDYAVTYCPDDPATETIQIAFSFFDVEAVLGGTCWDALEAFDGPNTSSPLLGEYCNGSNTPGILTSSDPTGCLTFAFSSDGSSQEQGWEATVNCVPPAVPCNNNGVQDGDETGIDCGGASCPACPGAGCGGITVGTVTINGVTDIGGNQYTLAYNGTATFSATGTVLPTATGPDPAGLTWNIFSCPPQIANYNDPQNDPCFIGTDFNAIATDDNDGTGLSGTYTSVWVLPVTFDDACEDLPCDLVAGPDEYPIGFPDDCVAYGTPLELIYLPPGGTGDSPCECGEPVDCGGAYFASEAAAQTDFNNTASTVPLYDFVPDLPATLGTSYEFCYEFTTGSTQTIMGFTQQLAYTDTGFCDFDRVYHVYTADCATELTSIGTTIGTGLTYAVIPNTTYSFCVDITVTTSNCTTFNEAFVWLWGDSPAPPAGDCGDCNSPDCNIVGVPTFEDRTYPVPSCETLSPFFVGPGSFTSCYSVTTDVNGNVGLVQQNQLSPLGCVATRTAELFAVGACGAPIAPTVTNANGVGSGFNPEWSGLTASTNYVICVETSVTGACTFEEACTHYYGEVDTPVGVCGDCSDPTCPIGQVPTYDDRSYLACFNPEPDLGPGQFTNCYTATTDGTGTLGFVQGHTVNASCDDPALFASYSYELYDVADCGGTVIVPNNGNANGQSNTFNPEYMGLLTNHDYVICITLDVPADPFGDPFFDCVYDQGCLDYYYIPSNCNITVNNALAEGRCQNESLVLNATDFYTGTPTGTLTYSWSSAPNNVITGSTTGATATINTAFIETNTITLTISEDGNPCGSGTVEVTITDCGGGCTTAAGDFTVQIDGIVQTECDIYDLPDGSYIEFISQGNFTLPPPASGLYPSGIAFALFSADPSALDLTDPATYTGGSFIDADPDNDQNYATQDNNCGGTSGTVSGGFSTIWVVPVTYDYNSCVTGGIGCFYAVDDNSDGCVAAGCVMQINYLNVPNTTVGCGDAFTDPGGPTNDYCPDADITYVICPDVAGEVVEVDFSAFSLETPGAVSGCYDELNIFNGNSATAGALGGFCGTNSPGVVTSTDASGCLTFVFTSDGSGQEAGWEATVNCISPPPVCDTDYYDPGGVSGNYPPNQNITNTICPDTPGDIVTVTFSFFNVDDSFNSTCSKDHLEIYDGTGTGNLIGIYCDDNPIANGQSFTSTDPDGCLTFVFSSNGSGEHGGWAAFIECGEQCSGPRAFIQD